MGNEVSQKFEVRLRGKEEILRKELMKTTEKWCKKKLVKILNKGLKE